MYLDVTEVCAVYACHKTHWNKLDFYVNNYISIVCSVLAKSLLCSPKRYLFDQKYSKNSNIAKCYYNLN